MTALRLGAVSYLNSRPLVHGLGDRPDLFAVRTDLPSTCATLLHEGVIDVGLIPSIEYLQRQDYHVVPGVAVASRGPVASVALFTTRPIHAVRSIAVDASSRTSAALVRVLCARWFHIDPVWHAAAPELDVMTRSCDAALLIGDPALFADYEAAGLEKIDLGAEWTAMTGLPFVWACWVGRMGALSPEAVRALQRARDGGVSALSDIAREFAGADAQKAALVHAYLRDNIRYELGPEELAGLRRFYDEAGALGLKPCSSGIRFYLGSDPELGVRPSIQAPN
jgi:chorismate dehydratase